jgi:hypothetical protein
VVLQTIIARWRPHLLICKVNNHRPQLQKPRMMLNESTGLLCTMFRNTLQVSELITYLFHETLSIILMVCAYGISKFKSIPGGTRHHFIDMCLW